MLTRKTQIIPARDLKILFITQVLFKAQRCLQSVSGKIYCSRSLARILVSSVVNNSRTHHVLSFLGDVEFDEICFSFGIELDEVVRDYV